MSLVTTIRIERPEGTVVASHIPVQIDQAGTHGDLDFDGARPYDLFWIYTLAGVPAPTPIQRRDVLFDEVNTDPETGALAKYRVVSRPETFANDHQEMMAEVVVGT